MRSIREKANAKINLYLDVISRREDGFHDIKTIMHSVDFGDDITVSVTPSAVPEVSLSVVGNRYLPTDNRNLASRAALLYLERAKLSYQVNIKIIKRIPVAAGLAGGSSDAAAVLRALNRIFDKLFTINALNEIAGELGSDVVYCLYGRAALCEGRGELITKIKCSVDAYVVIAIANEHVSTPQAYKALDELYSDFDGSVPRCEGDRFDIMYNSLKENKLDVGGLFNIFESAVLPFCRGAERAKARLISLGARGAMMSGSGPSVFGVFDTFEEAKRASIAMREEGFKTYYAKIL